MLKSINLVLDNGDEIELSYDEASRLYKALRELFDGKVPKDVVYRSRDESFGLNYLRGKYAEDTKVGLRAPDKGMKNVAKNS